MAKVTDFYETGDKTLKPEICALYTNKNCNEEKN